MTTPPYDDAATPAPDTTIVSDTTTVVSDTTEVTDPTDVGVLFPLPVRRVIYLATAMMQTGYAIVEGSSLSINVWVRVAFGMWTTGAVLVAASNTKGRT
jgi:hypothetical protein